MDRRAFVTATAAMLVPIAAIDLARAAGPEDRRLARLYLARLYMMTKTVVLKYYADAKTDLRAHSIHFEVRTRHFMVHEQRKTGEWQDAHEVIGPQRGGVVGDMELRAGKYVGAAMVPQAFDKRYFTLLVMAPYSDALDAHLYTHLLYPADVSKVFLSELTDLVARFSEYLD